jgi:hypothetical protein
MASNAPTCARALPSTSRILATLLILGCLHTANAFHTNRMFSNDHTLRPPRWGPPIKRADMAPLKITNKCPNTIWPGIGTQAGTGPGMGGFELASGDSRDLMVSKDWQGRVWGRTNCSFSPTGDGPANVAANMGHACDSGDCLGVLNCVATASTNPSFSWPCLTYHRA